MHCLARSLVQILNTPFSLAPVIIHCKSGRRAAKAEEVLKSKGYTQVYNAGGLNDLNKTTSEAITSGEKSGCSVM